MPNPARLGKRQVALARLRRGDGAHLGVMSNDSGLSDDDWVLLREAVGWRHGGIDLRFEGGPYIARLDALVARGYLDLFVGDAGYMVSYRPTDAGQAALAAHDAGA